MEIPKDEPLHKFCDLIKVIRSEEIFMLALHSGCELEAYVLTPGHIKRLQLALNEQIAKYEATHGEIKVSKNAAAIVSPYQKPDVSGNEGLE